MSKPPVLRPKELMKVLVKLGFVNTRSNGRRTVVPMHAGKTIGLGLMRGILSDIKMSVDELKKRL